ncbi:class I adenylate-forming enzyme family protein [Haloarculaceae archaeon H-GB1-1]|nr:class I adenylate-forming enzyme family protein [Haloarculaceae archaeon H-GB1-1]
MFGDSWPTRDLLSLRAGTTPERTAVVEAADGRTWTYSEYMHWVEQFVVGLESYAAEGDRIGILLSARPEFPALCFATTRRAMTAVPLNVELDAETLSAQAAHADLDVLVCGAETAALATDVASCPVVSVDASTSTSVETLAQRPHPRTFASRVTADQEALVVFTSGTTGEPRGVRLTVGNLVSSAMASAFRLGVSPDDRWLACLPMYHVGGLAPAIRSALYGTTLVVQQGFDAAETARVIDEQEITGVSLVPTMLSRLLDAGWSPPDRLRFVLLGGAPASPELVDRCEDADVPVHPTYGMTETASQVATATPRQAFEHPGTVGHPLLFTQISVQNDEGRECGTGETGELVVDGPTVSPGYLDADATAAAFDQDGLHTGDAGYRDEAGRLWVTGRIDDVIVTGGENVHPAAIADAIRDHPDVADVAVVGLPDPEWGERVAALVVASDLSVDGFREHCRNQLAGFERPKTVAFAESLPRTQSGTVDREAVADRLQTDGHDV